MKPHRFWVVSLTGGRDSQDQSFHYVVCVCMDRDLAHRWCRMLQAEADSFIKTVVDEIIQLAKPALFATLRGGASYDVKAYAAVIKRRNELIFAYAAKLTDPRWRDIAVSILDPNRRSSRNNVTWRYSVSAVSDDPAVYEIDMDGGRISSVDVDESKPSRIRRLGSRDRYTYGDRVRVHHDAERDRTYQDGAPRIARSAHDGQAGTIQQEHRGHGLCYTVLFGQGTAATYDVEELEPQS